MNTVERDLTSAGKMTSRPRWLLTAVLVSLLLASCGGGDSSGTPTTKATTTAGQSADAGSPEAVVLRLWREVFAGSPSLTYEYDPKVLSLLGTNRILTIFDSPPPEYSTQPRLTSVTRVPSGILVSGEA